MTRLPVPSRAAGMGLLAGLLVGLLGAPPASAAPSTANVSFGPAASPPPPSSVRDSGGGYTAGRGYGWIAQTGSAPKDISGRTRDRNVVADERLDQLIHMQRASATVTDPARWQYALASGKYTVAVTVGDPANVDSTHRVNVEGVPAVSGFVPTAAQHSAVGTVTVSVTDGFLTVDATGGTNTKLQYVTIRPAATSAPYVSAVRPVAAAKNVPVTTSVTVTLSTTINSGVDLNGAVTLTGPAGRVATRANTDGAGNLITLTPQTPLATSTTYRVATTAALKAPDGRTFTAYSSTFTTSSTGTNPSPVRFIKTVIDSSFTAGTSVAFGPDGDLYAASGAGRIKRYDFDSAGNYLGTSAEITAFANQRTIIGIAFDPSSTPTNLKLWVSNNVLGAQNVPDFTGKISVLTGAGLTNKRDVIVGLPRACKDHETNGVAFGPDGWLYWSQGSTSGYGAPDPAWCNRSESELSAAMLRANVNRDARFQTPFNANTDAGYDPFAANAPVQVYASGVRNAYDLVWHSNGRLYTAGNESGSGNTPAGPGGNPPALTNLPAYNDYMALIVQGGYYGHPNPSRGEFTLNGGNPTSAVDPFEVREYPVGVQPDPDWRASRLFNMGVSRSPNGLVEYRSGAFGGYLRGKLIGVEYSSGDDVYAATIHSTGNIAGVEQLISGLDNPLDVTMDPRTGNLVVTEYGPGTARGGQLALFKVA